MFKDPSVLKVEQGQPVQKVTKEIRAKKVMMVDRVFKDPKALSAP